MVTKTEIRNDEIQICKEYLLEKGKKAIDAKADNQNSGPAETFKSDFIAQVYELKELCRGYQDFREILNEVSETLSCDGEFDYLVDWLFDEEN